MRARIYDAALLPLTSRWYRAVLERLSTGDRLLSCGYGGHIVLWNGTSGEPLFEHEFNRVSNYADMSPDGSRIFVAGGEGTGRFVDVPPDSR